MSRTPEHSATALRWSLAGGLTGAAAVFSLVLSSVLAHPGPVTIAAVAVAALVLSWALSRPLRLVQANDFGTDHLCEGQAWQSVWVIRLGGVLPRPGVQWHARSNGGRGDAVVPLLRPGIWTEVNFSGRALRRGRESEIRITARSCAPFGLFWRFDEFRVKHTLMVRPKAEPVSLLCLNDWRSRLAIQAAMQERATQFDGEFHSCRDYRPGDPIKALHYRLSARRGTPVLLLRTSGDRDQLRVLLDPRLPRLLDHEARMGLRTRRRFDAALRKVLGLLQQLRHEGHRVSFMTWFADTPTSTETRQSHNEWGDARLLSELQPLQAQLDLPMPASSRTSTVLLQIGMEEDLPIPSHWRRVDVWTLRAGMDAE